MGRNAWLQAGLPVETPATTVDRQCGSAQQAVNFAAALIKSGVHDAAIGSGVEHMGHVPMGVSFKWVDDVGLALAARADGEVQPRAAGDLGRDDRRPVGDPALGARRDRAALASARAPGHRGGSLRARDRAVRGERRHLRDRPGHPPGHEHREAVRAEAGLQGGRQGHRRQLVADLGRRGRGAPDGARRRRSRSA